MVRRALSIVLIIRRQVEALKSIIEVDGDKGTINLDLDTK